MHGKKSVRQWSLQDGIPVRTGSTWINYYMKEKDGKFETSFNGYLLAQKEWTDVKEWARDRKRNRRSGPR